MVYIASVVADPDPTTAALRNQIANSFTKLWDNFFFNSSNSGLTLFTVLIQASTVFVLLGLIFIGYRTINTWLQEQWFDFGPLIIPVVLSMLLMSDGAILKQLVSAARTTITIVDAQITTGIGQYTNAKIADATEQNQHISDQIKQKTQECLSINSPANDALSNQCYQELRSLATSLLPSVVNDRPLTDKLNQIINSANASPGFDLGNFLSGVLNGLSGATSSFISSLITTLLKALGIAWAYIIEFVLLLLAIVSPLFISMSFLIGQSFWLWIGMLYAVALAKWSFTLMTSIVIVFANEAQLSQGADSAQPFVLEILTGLGAIFVSISIAVGAINLALNLAGGAKNITKAAGGAVGAGKIAYQRAGNYFGRLRRS